MARNPSAGDGTLLPELLLDRYRVESRLGEGGFGQVVLAYDTRLKRPVAIKTLRRALAATDLGHYRALEDRFNREAEAGSRVGDHPNLVTVYDLVVDGERTQYLICQFVPGGTLAQRIAQGPLPLADALRLTVDAARGLQAAHEAGIVHRDIKPANIFLAADGRAQVGDFGIAQMDHLSNRTHAMIGHPGTPLYMSPEQAQTTGYVRPDTDQYSLGLVLFEILTGKAYKRLREWEIEELLAEQPRAVVALIRRMIAPRPDDRYGSLTEAIEAITAVERQPIFPVAQREPETGPTEVAPPEQRRDTTPHLADVTVRDYLPQRGTPHVSLSPALPVMPPPAARTAAPRTHTRRTMLAAIGGLVLATGGTGGVIIARQQGSGSGSMTATPARPATVNDRATSTRLVGTNVQASGTTATTAPVVAFTGKPIKGTEITILWMPPSIQGAADIQEKSMDDWAKGAGVKLTKDAVALDQWDAKLATNAQTKQGADLVNMYAQHIATNENVMIDISDLADEVGKTVGGWYDGPKTVAVRDGKWKALPTTIYGQYWIYRDDLFKQVGIDKWPETWEDLHQAGKKLKAAGTPVGYTLGHAVTDGSTHNYSLMWSYGAKEFEADGKTIALDSKEMLDCLTFFQSFYRDSLSERAFAWDETGNNLAYTSGQVAATNNANTIYAGLLKNDVGLAGKSTHGTTLKGPGGAFQYMSMQYWGIPTYSKNVDAAKEYLRAAFYTKDFQTAWTKAGNGYNLPPFPMLDSVDAAWPTDPKLASARTLAKTTRMPGSPGPFTQVVGAAQNKFIIIDTFAKVAQGMTPKDAIAFAVNEYNTLLKGG